MERSCRNLAVILSTAIVVLAAAAAVGTAAGAAGGGDLPRQWQRWLNEEVFHIISGREREIFLRLENDEQREQFLAKFWEVRDPTPGTERNEYREEHERRLRYADETFGRGSVFRGRLTDRGRMYVTLGPPQNRYDFPNQASLY
ncbi:MAG TPA: GWxTD domain-containing protein, partial [Acidobacteriota bacterium]|nr:GWxTD domain-containing protein [Acidobacteriota bacterium]